jgi:predicted urease superfamily metal-dependent hydrolase
MQGRPHSLSQHRVNVCLLIETHLRSGETFQMANYVCHHTDQLTEGGRTAILVHWGRDHYTVPIQGVRYLEATVIQVMLASKPMKILGQSSHSDSG